jgi:hypothetical protein
MASLEEEFARAEEASKPSGGAAGSDPFLGTPGYTPDPAPAPAPPRAPTAPYKGMVLPFSVDESGNKKFDPRQGLLGSIVQPIEYVGDVMAGRKPVNVGDALETALNVGPGSVASRVGKTIFKAPATHALDDAAEAGFRSYRESGQMYPGDEYRSVVQRAIDGLKQGGFPNVEGGAPVPHAVLQGELDRVKNAPFVTSQDLDALRVQLHGKGLQGQNVPANMQAREALFGYIDQNLPPDSGRSVKDAVGNYRQARHSDVLTDKDLAKERLNTAKGAGPDLSAEQTRTNIAQLMNSRKATKGFSETEQNILDTALTATKGIDRAQTWGDRLKLSAPGGAMTPTGFTAGGGALGSIGAVLAGHPGPAAAAAAAAAALGTAGAGLRSYANRGARRLSEEADNAIRNLSPLAQQQRAAGTAPIDFTAGLPSPYSPSTLAGPAAAAAVRARREPQFPPRYQVLPDGTIQETL